MIDTHAHIDFEQYDLDRTQTLQRAFSGGMEKIINVGADMDGSLKSVELAGSYKNIYASIGLHPHIFNQVEEFPISLSTGQAGNFQFPNNFQIPNDKISKIFDELKNLAENRKVVAIGEIGLDYFSHTENSITSEQKENQKKGFVAQLELAKEFNLPVIIHCRDAYEDCYEIVMRYAICDTRFVFHCYGGNLEFTKKLLQHDNIFFSFTGNITYAKAGSEIIEVIKIIPIDKIMLETDCPYLTPVPYRGKRNEPAFVMYVNEKIAEIKQISAKEVDRITTQTAERFFEICNNFER